MKFASFVEGRSRTELSSRGRAKHYDPETGRWTTKDSILFNGGDTNLYGLSSGGQPLLGGGSSVGGGPGGALIGGVGAGLCCSGAAGNIQSQIQNGFNTL